MNNENTLAKFTVAIDGPVGAGKSTIARECARQLKCIYVDTGALYRAIGVYCDENGIDGKDIGSSNIDVELKFIDNVQRVFVNKVDFNNKIRTPKASMLASAVSAIPEVRAFLLGLQRSFAESRSVVMDGRDIGTVVLPNADVKIFLTADARERAKRRYDELVSKGENVEFDTVLKELNERDYNDSHRENAPLKEAFDSIVVNTTGNTFDESVEKIVGTIKAKLSVF